MSDQKKAEENKKIVLEFYHTYGNLKDPEKCRKFLGGNYVEHNPHIQDGVERFLRYVQFRRDHYPHGENNVMLTIADEDKVMLHVHSILTPGEPGMNIVDTYRVENGKIVEHWDVIQDIEVLKFPPLTDNGMFNLAGDSIVKDLERTEENKRLVTDFYNDYGIEKDVEKCKKYYGETLIQHNPHVDDGPESFFRFVRFRRKNFPQGKNMIKVTVAQGNLVGLHVHSVLTPGESGRNLVDIYRVEDGKIVEHWDTIQHIDALKFPPINDHGLY